MQRQKPEGAERRSRIVDRAALFENAARISRLAYCVFSISVSQIERREGNRLRDELQRKASAAHSGVDNDQ